MPKLNDSFNRSHMNKIREIIAEGTGVALKKNAPRKAFLKAAVVFAAFAVCLCVVTPALAAEVPTAYEILYRVSPETAQFFKPVQKTCDDQGIEVKVIEAYVDGGSAQIMITVRDTEADRIDDTVDLYDSYSVNTGFDSVGTCKQIGFDGSTKTATFLVTIDSMDQETSITGEKITFSVTTLLSKKNEGEGVPISIDWNAIPETVRTESADPYDGTVLVPGDTISTPYDGFYLTGTGYAEGKLHIQLYTPGRQAYDDHAFLYLQNEDGDVIPGCALYRGGYRSGNQADVTRADYIDYAFDVSQNELQKYLLYGDFYSTRTRIDGDWSITFPLENGQE